MDINSRSDVRLSASLEDPTKIDPGPVWVEDDKLILELYLCEVRGQEVTPVNIPDGYTCTLSAKRMDEQNDTEIFSQVLVLDTEQNGHKCFSATIDLSGPEVEQTLLIEDTQLTDGVRLRVQAKISSAAEILRPSFQIILRKNIDAA